MLKLWLEKREMQFLINILILSASGHPATPFKGYEWWATCGKIALKLIPPYTNLRHNKILACTFPKNYHTTKKRLCNDFKTNHSTQCLKWLHDKKGVVRQFQNQTLYENFKMMAQLNFFFKINKKGPAKKIHNLQTFHNLQEFYNNLVCMSVPLMMVKEITNAYIYAALPCSVSKVKLPQNCPIIESSL